MARRRSAYHFIISVWWYIVKTLITNLRWYHVRTKEWDIAYRRNASTHWRIYNAETVIYLLHSHLKHLTIPGSDTISISNSILSKVALSISTYGRLNECIKQQNHFTHSGEKKPKAAHPFWLYWLCLARQVAIMNHKLILLRYMKLTPQVIQFLTCRGEEQNFDYWLRELRTKWLLMATLASVDSLGCKWWQSNLGTHAIVSVVIDTNSLYTRRNSAPDYGCYGNGMILDQRRGQTSTWVVPEACLWLSQP